MRSALRLTTALLLAAALCGFASAQTKSSSATSTSSASRSSTASKSHKSTKKTSHKKEKGQMAPTSDRITEIQQALAKDGSYSSAPTGKWDDNTAAAMKKFQTTHALNPSGKLDARTLERLGLGSQTAGIAEPVAPPNSTSRLTGNSLQSSRQ
jgi:peptidoglycan hydrolase-like protein with peptidoglycan-binding domain